MPSNFRTVLWGSSIILTMTLLSSIAPSSKFQAIELTWFCQNFNKLLVDSSSANWLGSISRRKAINLTSSFSRFCWATLYFTASMLSIINLSASRDFIALISFRRFSIGSNLASREDSRSFNLSMASTSIGLSLFGSLRMSTTLVQTACSRFSALIYLFLHLGEPSRWEFFNSPLHT